MFHDFGLSDNLGFGHNFGFQEDSKIKLAICGDSISVGAFNYEPQQLYLSTYITSPFTEVENFGVGGRRVNEVDSNFQDVLSFRPNYVFMHVGTNDLTYSATFATEEDHFDSILSKCNSIGATLCVSEILPRGTDTTYDSAISAWNTALASWCTANDVILLECHDVMQLVGSEPRPNPRYFNESTLLHPNFEGYRVMMQSWLQSFFPYTSKARPPQNFLVQHLFNGTPVNGNQVIDRQGVETRPIQQGRCYKFNGNTNITSSVITQIGVNNNYTISFRFFMPTYTNGMTILNQIISSSDRLIIVVGENKLGFSHYDGTSYNNTAIAITTNTWYHVTCIHDGTTKVNQIYVNAVLGATTNSTAHSASVVGLKIGGLTQDSTTWKLTNDCLLFDLRIHTYKYTYANMINYYNMEYPSLTAQTTGFQLWLKMDEQSGSICMDSTGFWRNLTINGDSPHTGTQNLISFQNDVGYMRYDGDDAFYPLDRYNNQPTTNPPSKGDPDNVYLGRVKYNATLSSLAMDGETDWTDDSLTLTQSQAPALIRADVNNFWFTNGVANIINRTDFQRNNNNQIFSDTIYDKNILTYSKPQLNEILNIILIFLGETQIPSDYYAYYPLSSNLDDATTNNDLVVINTLTPSFGSDGKFGSYCMTLAGGEAGALRCTTYDFDNFNDGISILMSLNVSNLPSITNDRRDLIDFANGGNNFPLELFFERDANHLYVYTGVETLNFYEVANGDNNKKSINLNISNDEWVDLAVIYSNLTNIFKLYKNSDLYFVLDARPFEVLQEFDADFSNNIQGITFDSNGYIYVNNSYWLSKFEHNASGIGESAPNEIATVNLQIGLGTIGHVGDITIKDNKIYLPVVKGSGFGVNGTDCGVARYNLDLTIDSTFGTSGYLSLATDIPDNDISAICWDGSNWYISLYSELSGTDYNAGVILKYNEDFSTLVETITIDISHIMIKSIIRENAYSYNYYFDGITYDSNNQRFIFNSHSPLMFECDRNFSKDSFKFSKVQSRGDVASPFRANLQGIEWIEDEIFWIADRSGNTVRCRKIRRLPASTDYSLNPWSLDTLYLFNDAHGSNSARNLGGKFKNIYTFNREVTSNEIKQIFSE